MIRRSPSESYLKFLLVHPDNYEDGQILEIGSELSLEFLGRWYVTKIRNRIQKPNPFYPQDRLHLPSRKFLKRERIEKIFFPDADMRSALEMLELPRVRELTEVMILSAAPPAAISMALNIRMGFETTPETILLYKHYFWNVDLLDSTELRALLHLRMQNLLDDPESDIQKQFPGFKKAMALDARTAAAKLPTSPIAAILAQMQMGFLPRDIPLAEIMSYTQTAAIMRSYEAVMSGWADSAQKYAITADIMNKMLETVVRPDADLKNKLQELSIKTSSHKIPVIAQLTGGHHTVEIQPEPEEETDEEMA